MLVDEFKARSIADRTGMELFSLAQRMKVSENFFQMDRPYIKKALEVPDVSVKEIMAHLARYGGRLEITHFGTFWVADVPAKERVTDGVKFVRAARRVVNFKMSNLLRDMLNEDYFHQSEPTPNSDYFITKRNILV